MLQSLFFLKIPLPYWSAESVSWETDQSFLFSYLSLQNLNLNWATMDVTTIINILRDNATIFRA